MYRRNPTLGPKGPRYPWILPSHFYDFFSSSEPGAAGAAPAPVAHQGLQSCEVRRQQRHFDLAAQVRKLVQ